MTTYLVNRDDIAVYKQISKTVFDDVLIACILQAQIQDVAPLLGEKLFNKIMKTPSAYAILLNDIEYTVGGETFQNYGLKSVISNFAHANIVFSNL